MEEVKKKKKMKITKGMMDRLIFEAESHMASMFSTGAILVVMKEDKELFEASIPSIVADREYFRNEFDMIIGEA
tara:strand:+ start:197 stop:418 length:222 start_codon:yes stop_codon:yes gene_type:complete